MTSSDKTQNTTEVQNFDNNKDREEVLVSWGVKQEDPNLLEKGDEFWSPKKEILNDITITDDIPNDFITGNGSL